jgi:cysteine-rich repeat protein
MKKIMIFGLLVVSLFLMACATGEGYRSRFTTSASCSDSDGGNVPEVYGEATSSESRKGTVVADECARGDVLLEAYCRNGEVVQDKILCEYGCSEGACGSAPVCGNNVKEAGEVCDGTDLSGLLSCEDQKTPPGYTLKCADDCGGFSCIPPPSVCGNNISDAGEQCDYGALNTGTCVAPYGGSCHFCSLQCQSITLQGSSCGDGVLYEGQEQCDDGNLVNGDGCSSTCQTESQDLPDLVVDSVQLGTPVTWVQYPGIKQIPATIIIKNIGSGATGSSFMGGLFYPGSQWSVNGGKWFKQYDVGGAGLAAGASAVRNVLFNCTSAHTMNVTVDSPSNMGVYWNIITESNENNNVKFVQVSC